MLTEFEKQEAFNALRAKIYDATRLTALVTTNCAAVIAATAGTVTVTDIYNGKVAYDAFRTNSAEYSNHTLSALVNTTLFNEIATEASA